MSGPSDPGKRQRSGLFGRQSSNEESRHTGERPKPPRKPRFSVLSNLSGLLSFVLLGAVMAIGGVAFLMMEARKPGPLASDLTVNIVREDDGGSISEQLQRAGVIDSAFLFNILTVLDGNRGALKRGEYAFKAGVSMNDIERQLVSHHVVQHKITIPEGLTSDQIVQRLRDDDVLVGDIKERPREGSLMPDTYFFERGETRQAILTRMAKAQAKVVDEVWRNRTQNLPIKSPGEMVTLASIVEKETGKPDERPRVAGVFVNRLKKHMRLESDPTIVYGLAFGKGTLGHSITKAELIQPTPYNTYIVEGLPPGPISNPGKASLEAVANPVRTKELYFVADGTGGHVFADTLDEHLKNVAHWRQIEKDAKDRLAPDAAPQPTGAPAFHGAIEPINPESLGELAPPRAPPSAPPALLARLAKIGASRRAMDEAMASLASTPFGAKSIADLGAVVAGVNDEPVNVDALDSDVFAAGAGPLASAPVPPAMLADQRAREAKYGEPPPTGPTTVAAAPAALAPSAPAATHGPIIYDASEGTPLDPLLNKTYDLSYVKTVPQLGLPGARAQPSSR